MSKTLMQTRNFCTLGSQYTAAAINGVVPIVHSGSECCLRLYKGISFSNGYQGINNWSGNCTPNDNIHRPDLIFGGEKRIKSLIEGTLKQIDADLYVVLTGCSVDLAGDNTAAVVNDFKRRGVPIVFAETAGFKGSTYLGHELVVKAIIEQFVTETEEVEKKSVNLWMEAPYIDPFWSGNMEVIEEMLKEIGLKVNVLFGINSSVENWKRIPSAQFNLLISPWVGLETMELLKKRFKTPYLQYPLLPIGAYESRKFLQQIVEFADLDVLLANNYMKKKEKEFYYYMERASEIFTYVNSTFPDRFSTIADSMYTLSISQFLYNDLGLSPGNQYIIDNPPKKYRELIKESFSSIGLDGISKLIFSEDPIDIGDQIKQEIGELTPLILGSSWDTEIASLLGGYYLGISTPISERLIMDRSYAGYRGGLRLAEDVFSTILSDYNMY